MTSPPGDPVSATPEVLLPLESPLSPREAVPSVEPMEVPLAEVVEVLLLAALSEDVEVLGGSEKHARGGRTSSDKPKQRSIPVTVPGMER